MPELRDEPAFLSEPKNPVSKQVLVEGLRDEAPQRPGSRGRTVLALGNSGPVAATRKKGRPLRAALASG
jgi:hypothetical protein